MKILIVALVALSMFLLLKVIRLSIERINKSNRLRKQIRVIEPVLTFLFWVIILFWGLKFLLEEKSYYPLLLFSIIIILCLALGWFFVKDFIAGIIFRIQNDYSIGEMVQFGNISGKVYSILATHICIQTPEGKIIKIPYSRLSNELISQKPDFKALEQHKYTLRVSGKGQNSKEISEKLLQTMLLSPWIMGQKSPMINFLGEDHDTYTFEIMAYTRNEKHFGYLISMLKDHFNQINS